MDHEKIVAAILAASFNGLSSPQGRFNDPQGAAKTYFEVLHALQTYIPEGQPVFEGGVGHAITEYDTFDPD